jgi:N6-L-threonylcarbamoyladenine synthase
MNKPITILAIETSCDETAVAIVRKTAEGTVVLSNIVSSQIALHAPFGGVVPDLAAREHTKNILPVLKEALGTAQLSQDDIDAIAVTNGPGLIPALLIGTVAGKTLAYVWKKPLLGIHHIEGHIYANFIQKNQLCRTGFVTPSSGLGDKQKVQVTNLNLLHHFDENIKSGLQTRSCKRLNLRDENEEPVTNPLLPEQSVQFPLLALVVSGGHTQLVLMQDHFRYEILGETQDDACGEAFDKVAKMLGLPYPGGPVVAKRADEYAILCRTEFATPSFGLGYNQKERVTNPLLLKHNEKSPASERTYRTHEILPSTQADEHIRFPRPMLHSSDFNFSFSGLKTAVLYTLKKHPEKTGNAEFMNEVCYEFQEAVIETLVEKTRTAIEKFQPKTLVIAGGVSANVTLRARLADMVVDHFPKTRFMTPEFTYSLDNAAMIATAAAFRWERMNETQKSTAQENWKTLTADSNLTLQDL